MQRYLDANEAKQADRCAAIASCTFRKPIADRSGFALGFFFPVVGNAGGFLLGGAAECQAGVLFYVLAGEQLPEVPTGRRESMFRVIAVLAAVISLAVLGRLPFVEGSEQAVLSLIGLLASSLTIWSVIRLNRDK